MTKEEKLEKVTKNFSSLSDEKQNYILGILQALTFAHDVTSKETTFLEISSAYAGEKIKHD